MTPLERITVRRSSVIPPILFLLAVLVAGAVLRGTLAIYGSALLLYLGGKLFLSVLPPRRPKGATPDLVVGVVVTVYNEDPTTLERCLRSLANQTYAPNAIVIVDDFSDTFDGINRAQFIIKQWDDKLPGVVLRHQRNLGKREALATGFRKLPGADIFLCVDSDAVLDADAIRQGVRAFLDPRVVAATGVAVASNHRKNLLTRLIDLRYINAFLGERAAYSRFGSVLCVTGVLAFWRADKVREHLDEFLAQTFLGSVQTVGDDRHLTNLLQQDGRVVLARGAIAGTVVPERIGHYVRQQARWGRSFWRESLWAIRHLPVRQIAWWLSLIEVCATLAFTFGLLLAVVIDPILTGTWHFLLYLQWVAIGAWARSVHAFTVKREGSWRRDAAIAIICAPVFGLLCLFLVLPMRVWALITIRKTTWGTRSSVEVTEVIKNIARLPVKVPVARVSEERIVASRTR